MVAHLESFKNSTDSVVLQQVKTKLTEEHIARMGNAKRFAQQALDIRLHDLPEDHFATYTKRLAMVSVNDVQRVARNMIRTNNMNVCVAGAPEILEGLQEILVGVQEILGARGSPWAPLARRRFQGPPPRDS